MYCLIMNKSFGSSILFSLLHLCSIACLFLSQIYILRAHCERLSVAVLFHVVLTLNLLYIVMAVLLVRFICI